MKWKLEAVNDSDIGWYLVENSSKSNHALNSVGDDIAGLIFLKDDLVKSKKAALLVSNSHELLECCKEVLDKLPKDSKEFKRISSVVDNCTNLDKEDAMLNIFDDMTELPLNSSLPPIKICIESGEVRCNKFSKLSDLLRFEKIATDIGFVSLNILSDFVAEEDNEIFLNIKYPIQELISEETFLKFMDFMNNKFANMGEFLNAWNAYNLEKEVGVIPCTGDCSVCTIDEHECPNAHIFLSEYIQELFLFEFGVNFEVNITLFDYLNKYPVIGELSEFVVCCINVPNYLADCKHTYHLDMNVSYKGLEAVGAFYYKEQTDSYYLVTTSNEKSKTIIVVRNKEEDLKKAKLNFLDFLA